MSPDSTLGHIRFFEGGLNSTRNEYGVVGLWGERTILTTRRSAELGLKMLSVLSLLVPDGRHDAHRH